MDPNSGRIYDGVATELAKKRGLVRLTKGEALRLLDLPPAQRPGELLGIRASHALAQLPGLTQDDVRKLRNAAKRERRERRGK